MGLGTHAVTLDSAALDALKVILGLAAQHVHRVTLDLAALDAPTVTVDSTAHAALLDSAALDVLKVTLTWRRSACPRSPSNWRRSTCPRSPSTWRDSASTRPKLLNIISKL